MWRALAEILQGFQFSRLRLPVNGWRYSMRSRPNVGRVGFIIVPETPAHVGFLRAAEAASLPLQIKLIPLAVHNASEIERAVSEFAREPNGGLIVVPHAVTVEHRNNILGLAARYRLPALYSLRNVAQSGGLISYGTNPIDPFRQGACLCRPYPQGRETSRPAGAIADEI